VSTSPLPAYTLRSIVYTLASRSQAGTRRNVSVDPSTGIMTCSCPARRDCWHRTAVRNGAAGKPRIRVQPRPTPQAQARATQQAYEQRAATLTASPADLWGDA
jgi:hypothetical protein